MSGKNIYFKDKIIRKVTFIKTNKKKNLPKKELYCIKNSFKYFIGYNDNDII